MARFSESQGGAIMADDGSTKGPRVYFDVDDINAGVARVKELGGEASDSMPVPSMGWFATCSDSQGNDVRPLADRPVGLDVVSRRERTCPRDCPWDMS